MTVQDKETTDRQQSRFQFCLSLYATQFKIGLLTFGGGVAMIPYFHRESVEQHKWVSEDEFVDVLATALTVPGPLAVTFSLILGHRTGRLPGAVAGLLGIISPALVLVTIVALLLQQYANNPTVESFLQGAGAAVVGLIGYAAYLLGRKILSGLVAGLLALALLMAVLGFGVHPLLALLAVTVIAAIIDVRVEENDAS